MRILSIIALVLTSFLIINTVTTLVAEQIKIIGTMKAIGGTRQAVMRGYLFSIAIYGMVGTVLSIPGAYGFMVLLGVVFIHDISVFSPPFRYL